MSNRQQNQLIEPTYYDVLGVPPTAADEDIKLAYRRLVVYWHPDKRIYNSDTSEEHLKTINEAYSHLKTRAARSRYDQLLRLQEKIQRLSSPSRPQGKWGQFWNWLTMLESNNK